MTLTEQDAPDLIRLTRWALRRYANHPEWDDLLGEGLLGATKSAQRCLADGTGRWQGAAVNGALWAAQGYLREKSSHRTRTRHGTPLPTALSWEALVEEGEGLLPAVEDQALAVIDRVAAAQLWQQLSAPLSERDRVILERTLGRGERLEDVGRAVGLSTSGVHSVGQRALAAVRARLTGEAGE